MIPTPSAFSKVLLYKWEAYCCTNGRRTAVQMGGVLLGFLLVQRYKWLGSDFGRADFSRIFIFGPPDFFADFVAGLFLLIFVGKSVKKNPPGKSPAKSSNIYTAKIPDTFLQRGRAKKGGSTAVKLEVYCRTFFETSKGWGFQGPLNGGGFKRGGSRSGLVLPFLSFLVLFGTFPIFPWIFPICSGMVRGFSRLLLFLFLGLLRAPTRNSPERVRDTIWTFPKKSGKHPGLETPRLSFSQGF